ncbi:MAG: hypothetical protein J3Q66DRAFT_441454 [Benniella sp.]|nr:MAG: hypothetical protein J3Q66DRAFT_441454 [Benniella sp.]
MDDPLLDNDLENQTLSSDRQDNTDRPHHSIRIPFDGSSTGNFRVSKSLNYNGDLNFDARILQDVLSEGHYSIVWCVTPDHCGNILFDELLFEVEVAPMKHKIWAKVSKDDIHSIRSMNTSRCLRLRLQQNLHIRKVGEVFTRISGRLHAHSNDGEATLPRKFHFQVHYMELTRLEYGALDIDQDYEIRAPGQLLQRLNVGKEIISMDVSSSGEHVAILSADHEKAYVSIWDMEAVLRPTSTSDIKNRGSNSLSRSSPRATFSIPLPNGDFTIMRLVRIAISSDGLRVVLYQQPHNDDSAPRKATSESSWFPPRCIRDNTTYVTAKDLQGAHLAQTTQLIEDTSIHPSMDQFVGYGKFMSRDTFGIGSQVSSDDIGGTYGDYFVTCNESRIAVYDVDKGFKSLYGISIGELYSMKTRADQLRILHQSLQGPAFVWLEDLQHVSIWDIVSGTNLKYISIHNPHSQSQDEIGHIKVSPGGRLMALAGKNWIRTFFMDSGIEISSKVIHEGDVLTIEFLDHDKALLVTIGKPSKEQISLIMDALNLSSWNSTPKTFPSSSYSIQHVGQFGMEGQKIGGVMMGVNYNALEILAIPQSGVLIPGGPMTGRKGECSTMKHQELSKHTYQHPGSHLQYQLVVDFEERETGNRQYKVARIRLYSLDSGGQEQNVITIVPEACMPIDMNENDTGVCASFIEHWPQFIITTSLGFQVWNLPHISPNNRCEMALSWAKPCLEDIGIDGELSGHAERTHDFSVCVHGECVKSTRLDIETNSTKSEVIQIPKSNWISRTEALHCINSIPVLASSYTESSTAAKEAIIRYIVKHINHDPPDGTIDDSVMTKIARSAKWDCCSVILNPILRSTDGKWIPRCSLIGTGSSTTRDPVNPIMLLVKDAKKVPLGLSMAEQMMDYCIRLAKSQCDAEYIRPVVSCLRMLADHHPETAIDITRRAAFIPVKNQDFLVNRSILARPIWRPIWDKIMRRSGAIYEYPDPVFQLKSQLPKIRANDISTHIEVSQELVVDPMNRTFKGQVYVAPYSLLWHYTNEEVMRRSSVDESTKPAHTKAIATLIWTTLNIRRGRAVLANFSDLDFFDNPAVEALIQYKWDSIAWKTWAFRYILQLFYSALIGIVVLVQIYQITKIAYLQVFLYSIIAMSLFFLYLELKDFLADYRAYISSPYNVADVAVLIIPLVGSIQLLFSIVMYENTDAVGYSRELSYSIVLIYVQMLFELRVFRNVCHITTFIWYIFFEVLIVCFILASFIFSIGALLLHMLWGMNHDCTLIDENGNMSVGPWSCPPRDTAFPRDLVGATFASFNMMFGQYDALNKELQARDIDIGFLVAACFAVVVVILMNIVIAITNSGITRATYYAHLAWLSSLLGASVTVEELSVSARRYREQVDLFPHRVYYALPPSLVEEFKKKHQKLFDKDEALSPRVEENSSAAVIINGDHDCSAPCQRQMTALFLQQQEQHQQQQEQSQQLQLQLQQLQRQLQEQDQHQEEERQQRQQQQQQLQQLIQQLLLSRGA